MKWIYRVLTVSLAASALLYGQSGPFEKVSFLLGDWQGTGSGFGNEKSVIASSFKTVMDGMYIEVLNDSRFEPTEKKPEGEHHIDRGFISFDKAGKRIVFRQFNSEGFINQYVLSDSLSNDTLLVFETEAIERLPRGRARWTIRKISDTEIETTFDVAFSGDQFSCFGVNRLKKKEDPAISGQVMKISMTGVIVDDPVKAHTFYTDILGFESKEYVPEAHLAVVVSAREPDGTALLLEPSGYDFVKVYQKQVYEAGLPVMVFGVDDLAAAVTALKAKGVRFRKDLTRKDWGIDNLFEDTCGNLIMLIENVK